MSISEIIQWATANPMSAFGALVGFTLGIFYGFDGWRGSAEPLDFKESPRVKNLLWVAGGAYTVFIGDLKAMDPSAKKPLVLLAILSPS